MKRVLFQSRLVDNGTDFAAMQAAMRTYAALMRPNINSAEIATEVHRQAYVVMGCADPYRQMKIDADAEALKYVPAAEEFINSADDSFRAAVRVSIIGNIMDFGSGIAIDSPDDFGKVFLSLLAEGVGSDQTDELYRIVTASTTVLYAFDNCGESQFDRLLIRRLRAMGKRVVGVVRGTPILNDVTREDACRIGLDRELDGLVDTGTFAIGIPSQPGPALTAELGRADVLIAKGMANYESLSDLDLSLPVAYLMRCKCLPVSKSVGVPLGTNVVRIKPATY